MFLQSLPLLSSGLKNYQKRGSHKPQAAVTEGCVIRASGMNAKRFWKAQLLQPILSCFCLSYRGSLKNIQFVLYIPQLVVIPCPGGSCRLCVQPVLCKEVAKQYHPPACTVRTDGTGQVKSYSLRNAS